MLNSIQIQLDEVIAGVRQLSIDIEDDDGVVVGALQPLTMEHLGSEYIIKMLTDWRNQNMENFLTQFIATPQRTRQWMQDVLFQVRGQMLFLVYAQNNLIGHFGFKNLTSKSVLLDNAIRGERIGHPKLFVFAGKALVRWLQVNALVKTVYGEVMTNNIASIMMNKQIGFSGWKRHPLLKVVSGIETCWELGAEGDLSPDGKYCFKLLIE